MPWISSAKSPKPNINRQGLSTSMKAFNFIITFAFGAIFLAGGLLIANETAIPYFINWQTMQAWHASKAEVQTVESGKSYTKANYRYQFNGRSYIGNRVNPADFNDNIGDYQQTLQQHLKQAKNNQRPITVWVNPANPNQAVIDKQMRWGLFALMSGFCLVFALIGGAIIIAGIASFKNKSQAKISISQAKEDWQANQNNPEHLASHSSFIDYLHQVRHQQKKPMGNSNTRA